MGVNFNIGTQFLPNCRLQITRFRMCFINTQVGIHLHVEADRQPLFYSLDSQAMDCRATMGRYYAYLCFDTLVVSHCRRKLQSVV